MENLQDLSQPTGKEKETDAPTAEPGRYRNGEKVELGTD